jgi:TolB-like protein/Tfp pilus assembly protein PilF
MADLQARLQGALGDAYHIEKELGGGGMSRLFLATEVSLHRQVVIKLLPPEFTSEVSATRFKQEIELAAHLQHPNILPVFTAGAKDDLLFYVMPFVSGESLRHRLTREGKLPVSDAVRILHEVADALAYAHAEGVIHRDIKPENILLEGGHAVLTDFGVARALAESRSGGRITDTGLALGTPGYMSPEQAAGERNIDARADVYALAVVGYEMLAGFPPFAGPTAQAVIAAHLTATPKPLTDVRPDTPPEVANAIARALAKDPNARLRTAAEFRDALGGPLAGPPARRRTRRLRLAALLGVTIVIVSGALVVLRPRSALAPTTVAVLYFDNLSPDTADAYLADGITEELIGRLGQIERLRVKGRATVQRYRRPGVDLVAAGRELGVAHLVSGTVRRARDRLDVTVELIRLPGGDRLWGDRYGRRGLLDLWTIQEDIARAVATAVAGRLAPGERARLEARATANAEAYDHFIRGNYYLARRTPSSVERAVEEYEGAVRLDPRFTQALARIGYAHALVLDWDLTYAGVLWERRLALALDATERALRLDSTVSDAWMARGYLLSFRHPQTFEGATAAFERAIALDSANVEAHHQYASTLAKLGRDSAAAAAWRRALALEPDRAITLRDFAWLRIVQRHYSEALRSLDSALTVDPGAYYAYYDRARVRLLLGDVSGARRDAETALRIGPAAAAWMEGVLANVEVRAGDTSAARERVERLLRSEHANRPTPLPKWYLAATLVALGDRDRAIRLLERLGPRGPRLWFRLRFPELDPVRSDPRFQRLVEESRPPRAPEP